MGNAKRRWTAESISAVVGTVVAVLGLAFTVWTYRPAPATESTNTGTGSTADGTEPDVHGQVLGRWYVHRPPQPAPGRPNASIGMTMAYDFSKDGGLVINGTLVMSEFADGRQVEVTCSG